MKNLKLLSTYFLLILMCDIVVAQNRTNEKPSIKTVLNGFKFRNIGPAFMSGRIADVAIDPENENTWYVAVGSGGAWKTINAGTTWKPLTEKQPFYSTGCITIDPNNNASIWLGTGENVGGRHTGIGHGIYHSSDGGMTWKDMGLKKSEHISKIIVHPTNPNILWVAVQGPLWSSGGERGLYKSTDGGNTWKNTLAINEWTGVTDIVIDPTNPNILYAASWQRHRNVAVLMGGGPGTGIYKSVDGGDNWKKINNGIPSSNKGKIGLAISPMKSNVLYAAVELDRRKGAVYRTENSGGSWQKMSETVSGATGPHYYQELVASPHVFDKIYLMNVRMLVSENGGKTFYTMSERKKHSDNHTLAFKKNDPNYLLVGSDGGLYESFDNSETWKYIENLPVTQFYKLAVDDTEPFYNIYGGTQDNSTEMGPSRTVRKNGITNSDWEIVLGGDGHQPATTPGNPNIVYAQWQQGNINRIDRTNGETVYIQPQAGADEPKQRFNWDSPILVSQHDPKRIYFASQRVWRSDNRGDSWTAISGDLTKNQERMALPVMGKVQSFDNAWDIYAMSTYNTITSLAESKVNENVIYAGTDDGIIQYTKDGGKNWTKILVNQLPKTPSSAFVNDIKADLFNENTAYVALDNHKFGDYKPYLFKTTDGGKTWIDITNGLPKKTMVWRIVQDHENSNLLFLGTEYGLYVSLNQGSKWHKFSGGMPTIPIRDLAIQKRENDLVLATFGRGFYVVDDYSPLRKLTNELVNQAALLFPPRKALQYNQMRGGSGNDGGDSYSASNPPYGAVFSYYIKEGHITKKAARQKSELSDKIDHSTMAKLAEEGYNTPESILEQNIKKLAKETEIELSKLQVLYTALKASKSKNIPFPGWDALDAEINEPKAEVVLIIKDSKGNTVNQVTEPLKKGFNRVSWNLYTKIPTVANTSSSRSRDIQILAQPGTYEVTLHKRVAGVLEQLAGPENFEVERIRKGVLTNPLANKHDAYYESLADFSRKLTTTTHHFDKASKKLEAYQKNLSYITKDQTNITKQVYDLLETKNQIQKTLRGSAAKKQIGEKTENSVSSWFSRSNSGGFYGPTATNMEHFEKAKTLFGKLQPQIDDYVKKMEALGKVLEAAGAPVVLD